MFYFLMHKNILTARLELSNSGELQRIKRGSNIEHLPLGCQMNDVRFHEWWEDRAVPKTRKGSKHALRELNLQSTESMLLDNLALSLTDCYWVKPINSDLTWERVSLFRNNFIDVFGELTFDTSKHLNLENKTLFRCASSQGELQKKWCIDSQGRRFLVKGNWGSSYQQSLNEIFATLLHTKQGFTAFTPYYWTIVSVDGDETGLGCYSYNFCSEDIEFISAWEVLQTSKLRSSDSWYLKFKEICISKFGFSERYVDEFLGYQILTDFIMSNTDRHMNNFGVLRNPDTLEYLGFAPIYDTGNSMFFRSTNVPTGNLLDIKTHSFLKREVDLLKYVQNRNLIDLSKLPTYEEFCSIYSNDIAERQVRLKPMFDAYTQKINYLRSYQSGVDIWRNH